MWFFHTKTKSHAFLSMNTILVSLGQKTPSQVWVKLHPSRLDSTQNTNVYLWQLVGLWWSRHVLTCTLVHSVSHMQNQFRFREDQQNADSCYHHAGSKEKRYQIPALHYPFYCSMKSSLDDSLQEYSITYPKKKVYKANKFPCSVSHSLDSATSYKAGIWKSTEMFYFLFFSCY